MACSHWVFEPYFGIRCVWTPFISRYRKNFELRTTSDKKYDVGSVSIVFLHLHFLPVLKTPPLELGISHLPAVGRQTACRPSAGLRAADLAPWWRGWALCGLPRQHAGNRALHRHRLHQLRRLGDGPWAAELLKTLGIDPWRWCFKHHKQGLRNEDGGLIDKQWDITPMGVPENGSLKPNLL